MTSLYDHTRLSLALGDYRRALGSDAGKVAFEGARTALLSAAADCGYDGNEPILLWADERVRAYSNAFPKSGRELDAMFRQLPRVDLERLLGEVEISPYAPKPSTFDEGSYA